MELTAQEQRFADYLLDKVRAIVREELAKEKPKAKPKT